MYTVTVIKSPCTHTQFKFVLTRCLKLSFQGLSYSASEGSMNLKTCTSGCNRGASYSNTSWYRFFLKSVTLHIIFDYIYLLASICYGFTYHITLSTTVFVKNYPANKSNCFYYYSFHFILNDENPVVEEFLGSFTKLVKGWQY